MTAFRGPGVRQIGAVGTTPKEHRLALAGQYAENSPGVPRSGLLVQGAENVVTPTAATGTLTYSVAPLAAVISRTAAEGVYTPTTTGATTVNTGAAPASGSRWDLIWVKQNDQEKGDADNQAILGVTQGTSGATPARPTGTVPAGALVIAEARIFSGTVSTTASPNTMTQVFPITAARGGTIPVRSVTERAVITAPALAQTIARLDLPGAPLQVWSGTRWDGPARGQIMAAKNTFNNSFSTVNNFLAEANLTVEPNRLLRVTVQVEAKSNTAGAHAAYTICTGGSAGLANGTVIKATTKRYDQVNLGEGLNGFCTTYDTGVGGALRISLNGRVAITAGTVDAITGAIDILIDDMGPA